MLPKLPGSLWQSIVYGAGVSILLDNSQGLPNEQAGLTIPICDDGMLFNDVSGIVLIVPAATLSKAVHHGVLGQVARATCKLCYFGDFNVEDLCFVFLTAVGCSAGSPRVHQ